MSASVNGRGPSEAYARFIARAAESADRVAEAIQTDAVRGENDLAACGGAAPCLLCERFRGDPLAHAERRSPGRSAAVSLAALPTTLIESQLSGHVQGSFIGVTADREGFLAACPATGCVFLDGVGELDPPVQVKPLRVLQERAFHRVGEMAERRFAGKVVAATHRDPPAGATAGRFRHDLSFRLCGDAVATPSPPPRSAGSTRSRARGTPGRAAPASWSRACAGCSSAATGPCPPPPARPAGPRRWRPSPAHGHRPPRRARPPAGQAGAGRGPHPGWPGRVTRFLRASHPEGPIGSDRLSGAAAAAPV